MKTAKTAVLLTTVVLSLTLSASSKARPGGGQGAGGNNHQNAGGNNHQNAGDNRRRDPGVNRRQDNQNDRVRDGVRDGELTRREAHTIKEKEDRVAELERRMKSDGKLTPAERAKLQSELNALNKEIFQQKHDAQTRDAVPAAKPPGANGAGLQNRRGNFEKRLEKGEAAGAITPREAKQLEAREGRIAELAKQLKADGKITPEERARLEKELALLRKDLHQQLTDDQVKR